MSPGPAVAGAGRPERTQARRVQFLGGVLRLVAVAGAEWTLGYGWEELVDGPGELAELRILFLISLLA